MHTRGIKLIFIAQVVLGCGIVFVSFLSSHGAALRQAHVYAYERLLRESGTSAGAQQILGMTPLEFASLASVVARDASGANEALLLCGVLVIALGIAAIILIRKES